MRIVCQQMILMKHQTLFLSQTRKDVAKLVVCCSRDWGYFYLGFLLYPYLTGELLPGWIPSFPETHLSCKQILKLSLLKVNMNCYFTLFKLEIRKWIVRQTVKTQMKCRRTWHFICSALFVRIAPITTAANDKFCYIFLHF